jgi:phosphatidylserine/phosphatidylglycerophosphate/cardiolipin synthase-like enzyme
MNDRSTPAPEVLERWLDKQRDRDPELYEALCRRREELLAGAGLQLEGGMFAEATAAGAPPPDDPIIALETIVRDGRPALLIKNGTFTREDSFVDELSEVAVRRLEDARAKVDPLIPLVGRIDVVNHPTGLDYLGTGWLIAEDVVVTNRHVAELLARRGASGYRFIVGRFGDPITASVGYGHEVGGSAEPSVPIREVIYIEPPGRGPDIALLRVDRRVDGVRLKFVPLADSDPEPGDDVVVVGYPARAPASVIPDQERMERLYGSLYDVKRAAPGKIDDPSRGWITHDCTTLGGKSGSPVVCLKSGAACALHFAGLYLVENYAVPASVVRRYRDNPPSHRLEVRGGAASEPPRAQPATKAGSDGTSVTIPLTITLTLGSGGEVSVAATGGGTAEPLAAAKHLATRIVGAGVLAVRPGVVVEGDAMRDEACLVVAAHPNRLDEVRARVPASFDGLSVQVRPASLGDQLGFENLVVEAPRAIAYDDDARTGPDFRLDWVREPMRLRLHLGPDRGFEELSTFLSGTRGEIVSSIYQFYADHIRAVLDGELTNSQVSMRLVADSQTRDHDETPPPGQFDRSQAFAAWTATGRFRNVYVPEGNGGLIDNAYHIKVTVRDGDRFWLSSGNWTRSSQPKIAAADRNDPGKVGRAGNREWHVVGESPTLAARFRRHILQDFERSLHLGGRPESLDTTVFVDVPETYLESVKLESPPERVIETAVIEGDIRVKPLLTPDYQGGIYCDAVLELIASARTQLLFQNQYIKVKPASVGRLGALVDALIRAAGRVEDCRIILRSDGSGFWDDVGELRRRGLDVVRHVRRLGHTHTKGIVVDGRQVLVGSHNWSQSGVTLNRDASLIIDDRRAAAFFADAFETDWRRATPLDEQRFEANQAPRLATGPAPAPGFRRVPLSTLLED